MVSVLLFLTNLVTSKRLPPAKQKFSPSDVVFNPLNAELNPICHLLALLGAHHILHVSRIRVNDNKPMHIQLYQPVICFSLRCRKCGHQWRTQEFFSGGVQQIQLRTQDRENGIWGRQPPSQEFWRHCNLVQEISFHIVKFS